MRTDSLGNLVFMVSNMHGTEEQKVKMIPGEKFEKLIFNKTQDILFEIPPKQIEVVTEDSLTLECRISAVFCIDISWFLNNKLITNDSLEIVFKNTSEHFSKRKSIYVQNLTKQHEGIYSCANSNYAVEGLLSLNISVAQKLEIEIDTNFESAEIFQNNLDDNIEIKCDVVSGFPVPVLKWLKNGEILTITTDTSERIFWSFDESFMNFKKLRLSDAANYSCVASNHLEKVVRTWKILVTGIFQFCVLHRLAQLAYFFLFIRTLF